MGNKAVALSAAALAVVVAGIIWTHEARKDDAQVQGISQHETPNASNESVKDQVASRSVAGAPIWRRAPVLGIRFQRFHEPEMG